MVYMYININAEFYLLLDKYLPNERYQLKAERDKESKNEGAK